MVTLTKVEIVAFLQKLGQRYAQPAELYLIGGAALCLLGNPRTTLDLDFVGNDLPTAAERARGTLRGELEKLADELQIEVEAVPFEQFIPLPLDVQVRHHLFGQFGALRSSFLTPIASPSANWIAACQLTYKTSPFCYNEGSSNTQS